MTLNGQILCQPPPICLLQGHHGQFLLMDEVPTPTFVKTEKAEEKIPSKQAAIPHILILNKPQNNKPAEEECKWGPQCPICTQATQNIKTEDTEEDWNGNMQRNGKED